MSDSQRDSQKKPPLLALLALFVLAGIPLTRWWLKDHSGHPFDRLARDVREEQEKVVPLGRTDLACPAAELRQIVGEVWVVGCGKRARYVKDGDQWRRDGDVERDEGTQDNCRVRWKSDADASPGPREAAEHVHQAGQTARVRVPIAKYDVPGFKKLRYGETIDAYFKVKEPLPEAVPLPCVDPDADGGYRDGTCPRPWTDVSEIDACDE